MKDSIGDEATRMHSPQGDGGYSLSTGDVLGQYKVTRPLGKGGMGEVYEVEHQVLGRHYALKLLPTALEWQVSLERFKQEARVMATLNHPNIVQVDDFGETDGRYWLRMELIAAEPQAQTPEMGGGRSEMGLVSNLAELVEARSGRIQEDELVEILQGICEGLAYAHKHGAVHRDLKPSNILLERKVDRWRPKIADFGLVRLMGEEWVKSRVELSVQQSMSLGEMQTQPGSISKNSSTRSLLGTFEYMSPEQKRGEEVDERTDVYALGMMAFRLLTGQTPGLERPSEILPDLHKSWDPLLIGAMRPDPGKRTSSISAFLEEMPKMIQSPPASKEQFEKVPEIEAGQASSQIKLPPLRNYIDKVLPPPPIAVPVYPDPKPAKTIEIEIGEGDPMVFVWCPPTNEPLTLFYPERTEPFIIWNQKGVSGNIPKGFWIGKTPVTQGQWQALMGKNPSHFKIEGQDRPVEKVSFHDITKLIRLMNEVSEEITFRLPTEWEWEYACRAGKNAKKTPYSRDYLLEHAWFQENSNAQTQNVGLKKANAWGINDMLGNVWEWCQDWFGDGPSIDLREEGTKKVVRGGSWYNSRISVQPFNRYQLPPEYREGFVGLRLCCEEQMTSSLKEINEE